MLVFLNKYLLKKFEQFCAKKCCKCPQQVTLLWAPYFFSYPCLCRGKSQPSAPKFLSCSADFPPTSVQEPFLDPCTLVTEISLCRRGILLADCWNPSLCMQGKLKNQVLCKKNKASAMMSLVSDKCCFLSRNIC